MSGVANILKYVHPDIYCPASESQELIRNSLWLLLTSCFESPVLKLPSQPT